jgi:hypothetical protein
MALATPNFNILEINFIFRGIFIVMKFKIFIRRTTFTFNLSEVFRVKGVGNAPGNIKAHFNIKIIYASFRKIPSRRSCGH